MNIIEERTEGKSCFQAGASSIIGGRNYQQDFGYLYIGEQDAAAVVCDGMGGMEGGELASRTAVELFQSDFHKEKAGPVFDIPSFLWKEANKMDEAVCGLKSREGKPLKSGTTLIAVYCRENRADWISVGDSKIYLIQGKQIKALNVEHNYRLLLTQQLEEGSITQTFFEKESQTRQAEALTSYIGMDHLSLIDYGKTSCELNPGDIIMLCSDGVYRSLEEDQILGMVQDNDIDMAIAADRLTAMALRYGGKRQDNTTVILMKYGEK